MTERNDNMTSHQINHSSATLEDLMHQGRDIRAAHLKAYLTRAKQSTAKAFKLLPALMTPRAV